MYVDVFIYLRMIQNADTFVVGVRDDYLLHCYTLSTGTAELVRFSHLLYLAFTCTCALVILLPLYLHY